MTQETPPGWYPDPGQTSDGPATERWWDGRTWTDQTRPESSAAAWGPPAVLAAGGAYPAYPEHPPAGTRRGLRTGIAVAVAVAVLAGIGGGVYVLTKHDGGSRSDVSSQAPGGRGGSDGGPGGGSGGRTPDPEESKPSESPRIDSGSVPDSTNGISIPIPEGWYGQSITVGGQVTSDTSYKCPGDLAKTCTKGGAYSAPALALRTPGSTPEAVAKADIAPNAEDSYGGTTYGKITSHDVLAAKAVTVAGQQGYLVRWRAVTSKGVDGIVESLAFPAPSNPQQIVVVRFGIDADQKQSVIDEITSGIRVSSAGGGSGQNV
ncbi:DUF2510 domain-containing protein [Streptomyces graminilatus]|uniref:DUF2510 domain-containing protein n=1 Tax=Streptomyces graminilatus TaxID=1464070 RepID=UPI0006E37A17|nr:DUF2510 domain-containing protein [Streptomyces graminilatus]